MSGSIHAPDSLMVVCSLCGGEAFSLWADGRAVCEQCGARMGNVRAVVLLPVAQAPGLLGEGVKGESVKGTDG